MSIRQGYFLNHLPFTVAGSRFGCETLQVNDEAPVFTARRASESPRESQGHWWLPQLRVAQATSQKLHDQLTSTVSNFQEFSTLV